MSDFALKNSAQKIVHLSSRLTSSPSTETIPSQLYQTAKNSRKRGVVLSQQGWQKLMQAEVLYDDFGKRYTHEQLSERSLLDTRTVSRILSCEVKVDKRTLKIFFQAFNLSLESADYTTPDAQVDSGASISSTLPTRPTTWMAEVNLTAEELAALKQSMMQDLQRIFNFLSILDRMSESTQVGA